MKHLESARLRTDVALMRVCNARSRFGAATLEMALVAPIIFLVAFGSIEFSRVVMIKQALTNSAREGCRTASLATTKSDDDIDAAARNFLRHSAGISNVDSLVNIVVTPQEFASVSTGDSVTTSVSVNFSDVSWLPPQWTGEIVLSGVATMRRE